VHGHTPEEEIAIRKMHEEYKDSLTIPKRPKWDKSTTKEDLLRMEKEEFLKWRRGLVYLEEEKQLVLTPYERNIEVWRQLWRVIERSELVVQIVDARNILFFQSRDLEKYVLQVNQNKSNLLLINKSDLLTPTQRVKWATYFESLNVKFTFFSAHMARDELELEKSIVDKYGQSISNCILI
jgi:large subunit GTPase 1